MANQNLPNPQDERAAKSNWWDYEAYLSPEMLGDKDRTLTVAYVCERKFFDPDTQSQGWKPVVFFGETTKGLILTDTNRRRLARLYGSDPKACIGKKIVLGTDYVKVFGEVKLVIRIRPNPVTVDAPPTPAPKA